MSVKTSELTKQASLESNGYIVCDTGSETGIITRANLAEGLKDTFGVGYYPSYGGTPAGKAISDSWAEIYSNIAAGKGYLYHIGDYKSVSLSAVDGVCAAQTLYMTVMGNDTYYRAGENSIGHHIDFISSSVLSAMTDNPWVVNSTATNNGTADETSPWLASELYTRLNGDSNSVWAGLAASGIQDYITEKQAYIETRYSSAGSLSYSTGGKWANMGKLWLPTEIEVFGTAFCSDAFGNENTSVSCQRGGGCNVQYPFFANRQNTATSLGRNGWWLACPARGSSSYWCYAGGYGDAVISVAYTGVRVPLCFRIGGTAYSGS